jgi:hypothetical protein
VTVARPSLDDVYLRHVGRRFAETGNDETRNGGTRNDEEADLSRMKATVRQGGSVAAVDESTNGAPVGASTAGGTR